MRKYEDPNLADLKGFTIDGSLAWQATGLTTATLTASSRAEETILAGVSGAFRRDVGVTVDHAFRRWLIGTVKLGYAQRAAAHFASQTDVNEAAACGEAAAQAWPNRPIRWVVPLTAGGNTDVLARLYGAQIGKALGQLSLYKLGHPAVAAMADFVQEVAGDHVKAAA